MSHTKGSWYANDLQVYPEETGKTIALIRTSEEDARLIAAAPDLLEMCKRLLDTVERHYENEQDIDGVLEEIKELVVDSRIAIAKAGGR